MKCLYVVIFLSIAVIILATFYRYTRIERFVERIFNIGTRMECPTRNQSYDLRGEAAIIDRQDQWINNSGFGPLEPHKCARMHLI